MPPPKRTFLGLMSERLSDLIEQQSAEVFARAGLVIPVKSCSLLTAIEAEGPASIADLMRVLDRSHQLIQQKLPKLVKLELVTRRPNPDDQRAKMIEITAKGREQLALLKTLSPQFDRAYSDIEEVAGPAFDTIIRTIESLESRSLSERMATG